MDVATVLNAAADLIEPEGCWTQGAYARHENGNPIGPMEDNATCWCLSGAIQRIDKGSQFSRAWETFDTFVRRRGHDHIAAFNDAPGRTQTEVVAALRKAAQRAKEAGHDG